MTIQPQCIVDPLTGACGFLLTPVPGAQVRVDVLPANPEAISVPGVSGPVAVIWSYSYTFAGLTIGN